MIGRPWISSCSFANATIEPANEIEPISAESTIASADVDLRSARARERSRWNSASEISAAAPPPTPLNSATICGIAVIFTLRAATAPKPPPISIPSDDHPVARRCCFCANVTTIATSIPTAAIWLPRRACAGLERNCSARMNADDRDQVEEVRDVVAHGAYVPCRPPRVDRLRRLAFLEHLEHPVGDDEAADDVRRREHDGDEADHPRERVRVGEAERRASRRRSRCRGSRSCPTSAACAAASAPSRSPRSRGRSRARGSSARRRGSSRDSCGRLLLRRRRTRRAVISSSKSSVELALRARGGAAAPGRCASRARLAWNGIVLGRLVRPTIVTSVAHDLLARLGQLAVAAGLGGEVDDHRAGPHRRDRARRDQPRGRPAGDRARS